MAYDPADLRLPPLLLRLLDAIVRVRLPVWRGWRLGVTRPGALFVAALAGVWAAALYSGNNLLYLCGAMLLMLAVAGLAVAARLLTDMPYLAPVMPALGEAGTPSVVGCRLSHAFPFAACVEVRWCDGVHALLRCTPEGSRLQAHAPAMPRGLYDLNAQELVTEAPLGLWRLMRRRNDAWQRAVLPAPVAWSDAAAYAGAQSSRPFREGDEWRDLRAYVRGDPPARIHWRKAVMGEWAVKRFSDGQAAAQTAILRVDLRGVPGDAFERLLGRVCFWMRSREAGRLVLGSREFDLADAAERRAAFCALAAARPESAPPAGHGGLLLALGEQRRAA